MEVFKDHDRRLFGGECADKSDEVHYDLPAQHGRHHVADAFERFADELDAHQGRNKGRGFVSASDHNLLRALVNLVVLVEVGVARFEAKETAQEVNKGRVGGVGRV